MFARAEMSLSQRGKSALEHAREVVVNAGRDIRRRAVLFTADLRTLVSHQQHPGEQNNKGVTPVDNGNKLSPTLKQYLDDVL